MDRLCSYYIYGCEKLIYVSLVTNTSSRDLSYKKKIHLVGTEQQISYLQRYISINQTHSLSRSHRFVFYPFC